MPPFGLSNDEFAHLNELIEKTYIPAFISLKSTLDGYDSEFKKRELDEHIQRVISFAPLYTINAVGEFKVSDPKLLPAINGYVAGQAKKIWNNKTFIGKDVDMSNVDRIETKEELTKIFREMYPMNINDLDKLEVIDYIEAYLPREQAPFEVLVGLAIEQFILHIRSVDFDDQMHDFFNKLQETNHLQRFMDQIYWMNNENSYELLLRPLIKETIDHNLHEVEERVHALIEM